MKLTVTRTIIDAIHSGVLREAPTRPDPVFGLGGIERCPGVPDGVLVPREAWADKSAYEATARKLAGLFNENFRHYAGKVMPEVAAAGPKGFSLAGG
jgi:phosphoenolpyruvate carboxykinase (ATP)